VRHSFLILLILILKIGFFERDAKGDTFKKPILGFAVPTGAANPKIGFIMRIAGFLYN
jgi:hypothetical protein